jgi:7-cyano-7-deazaguanine synthase in queuosine biosynthesis
MIEALVHYDPLKSPLEVRFGGRYPNFNLDADKLRAKALAEIDPLCDDFLEIASVVFVADSTVSRGGEKRSWMGQDWRREFSFKIPVRQPDFWQRPDVVEALTDAVSFLTEDDVHFDFVAGEFAQSRQPFLEFDPAGPQFEANEVILFSGGLDSFAGALETLATTSHKVLLVSHRSAQKVIPRQDELGAYLAGRFTGRVQHLQVKARRRGAESKETTQRSRSLLFTALGWAAAKALRIPRLSFYENGTISHNLPISPQVIGTMATRTTHPLALKKLNDLLQLLGPGQISIENRYEWLTKTDVVRRIEQNGGTEKIARAVSCTSIREQDTLRTHCGACSQCLDRRFAILAAGLEEHDPPECYATDVLFGARDRGRSVTMAVEWTRHALRLREMDERGFMSAFAHELMQIIRGHDDLTRAEALRRVHDLHIRHSNAVAGVLERVVKEKAADIVARRLSASSLVAMHLGQQDDADLALPSDPRSSVKAYGPIESITEEDVVPDPSKPLVAAFYDKGDTPVVAVEGLGRVEGAPAQVAHVLKPNFDKARASGLAYDDHPFVQLFALGCLRQMGKSAIRKNVQRCREQLSDFYRDVHGVAPDRHLLIEGKQPKGHRLEPGLQVTTKHRIGSS